MIPRTPEPTAYKNDLRDKIEAYYGQYGLNKIRADSSLEEWVYQLVNELHLQTQRDVVILIDEYDAAINSCLDKPEVCQAIQETSSEFYQGIKSASDFLRFVFVTGIMKYQKFSLFSGITSFLTCSHSNERHPRASV